MSRRILLIPYLFCVILLFSGCAPKPAGTPLSVQSTVGVAGFHQPHQGWQMLSSTRADKSVTLGPDLLEELDGMLADLLLAKEDRPFLGTEATRQCQELTLSRMGTEQAGFSGLVYWMDVGRCVQTDYLLIPQVLEWREREGGEWGVTEPGMVVLELTLLDVQNQFVAARFQYDEQQRSLSEDLLQAGKFFRRGGKWLPAKELIRDGLREGLREMGL